MRAVLCRAYGSPEQLEVADIPTPIPATGQVVVAVKAADVNFPDTLIIQGKYQFQPPLPFTPGSDVAGVITAIGEGVTRFHVGDRVIAFPAYGGFAEAVASAENVVLPIPAGVDDIKAAALQMTYSTSYYALHDRAALQPGETVLVLGAAGGVGLAAVELAKVMGARVIAAASSAAKLDLCRQYGADEVIDYTTEDLRERLKTLTRGNGVDVVYDPVGGQYAEPAIRSMAWQGRYLVVGFTSGDIPRIPLNLVLLKGCAIVGVFLGGFMTRETSASRQNLGILLEWLAAGKINPHVAATYPLARVADALNAILTRQVTGKVILVP